MFSGALFHASKLLANWSAQYRHLSAVFFASSRSSGDSVSSATSFAVSVQRGIVRSRVLLSERKAAYLLGIGCVPFTSGPTRATEDTPMTQRTTSATRIPEARSEATAGTDRP